MPIEHVSQIVTFDNLCVEVSVYRYICDNCGRRECFHDEPTPYGEKIPTPSERGWEIREPLDDGVQGARCAQCHHQR